MGISKVSSHSKGPKHWLSPLQDILALGDNASRKRHWFVWRKIRIFLHKIADAKRLGKKVNLRSKNSKLGFWDTADEEQAFFIRGYGRVPAKIPF